MTGDENGAQRVAWTETWALARATARGRRSRIFRSFVERDAAGNDWYTLPGRT